VEPAIIAGRVDPLIVPLPSGATFSLLIDLKKYGALDEKVWHLDFSPGRYTLQAEYEGKRVPASQANLDVKGIALMTYWVGKVASTPVAFNVVSGEETIPDR
jgi:hypothetical protein